MNISEIKDLMAQFDQSSLKEFSYRNATDELSFSKNDNVAASAGSTAAQVVQTPAVAPAITAESAAPAQVQTVEANENTVAVEGDLVDSPLVGVAYLSPAPDKPAFVTVGDSVKKGQTLLIIEAMKVMNEVPAPRDGIVTEILVDNEEVVEFGKGLVRIK